MKDRKVKRPDQGFVPVGGGGGIWSMYFVYYMKIEE
jgi:hypothetical protein